MNGALIASFQPLLATSRQQQWSLAWKDSPRVILSVMGLVLLWDGGQRDAQIKQSSGCGREAQQSQTLPAKEDEHVPFGVLEGFTQEHVRRDGVIQVLLFLIGKTSKKWK